MVQDLVGGYSAEPHLELVLVPAMAQSQTALKTFNLTNDIVEISPQDEIYKYDAAADRQINAQAPWSSELVHRLGFYVH